MPQDPNLYGQRPAKKQKREIPLSSSLAFTSQLSSLITAPSLSSLSSPSSSSSTIPKPTSGGHVSSSSGRPRPSKARNDIFSSVKAKRKPGPSSSRVDADDPSTGGGGGGGDGGGKIRLKHVHNTEEEKQDFARARRKMEEKARLYAAMKRGDYVAKENEAAPLVDFDRKWAERHPDDEARYSSSGSDDDDDDDDDGDGGGAGGHGAERIEYQDEFGRTRTGTRAEVQRLRRQQARSALGAAELEAMAAVPTARPADLIFGDAIQTAAFRPEAATLDAMAALAARRDREPTPPPDVHFDGRAEIRTKGTGFYQFSRDEGARAKEMADLEAARLETERVRRERADERDARRREIEARRREIGARRAEKMADSFLAGLAGEMGVASSSSPVGAAGATTGGDGKSDGTGEGEDGGARRISAEAKAEAKAEASIVHDS
ncbi:hypothetical protein F5Y14DRAFT_439891 [Nemania sp. NC0429]|nr:hypothetical protein F5Y14DRAFT_439891 [Nemania sp. NC0429]